MKSYSQAGQDLFVHNLTKGNKGTFLDLGCFLPRKINNTYLLELNGWDGISLDIQDLNKEWKERRGKFIQADCLTTDYNNLLSKHYINKTIDYLTLDMEGCGDRYKLLSKIIESDYNFKIITIEHDAYLGHSFVNQEKIPQRELLTGNAQGLPVGLSRVVFTVSSFNTSFTASQALYQCLFIEPLASCDGSDPKLRDC
jgi:hypothetical protein